MKQELFAPVGTKTYIHPKTKYIIVYTTHDRAQKCLRRLERGREGTKGKPELFPFKTGQRGVIILKFNKFTLAVVAKVLKKFPDEVLVFIGENYWFSELPQEIQGWGVYGGTFTQLISRMEGAAFTSEGSC